ncbi:hypothetical protein ABZ023_33285, partial [Streptomyces sp. NPDC006367]
MGRRKAHRQRRVRPQQMTADRAEPYEDRNRRALCRVCGGDLIRAERIRRDAAPETMIKHLDSDSDHEHDADLVWVWDEVQCDFCGGRGVEWFYQVAPLAAPRPAWLSPAGELLDTHGAVNQTPWTACGGCADLIEAENWDGTRKRPETSSALPA